MRGLALDPDNRYAALTTAEGLLRVFDRQEDLPEGKVHKPCFQKNIAAKVSSVIMVWGGG